MLHRRERIERDLESLPRRNLEIVEPIPLFDPKTNPLQPQHDEIEVKLMVQHLMASLEQLVDRVFTAAKEGGVGNASENDSPMKVRWIEAYFPFTSPSFELEVYWQGEWLELLGCGIVKQSILNNAGLRDRVAWAWGIGIERLAMLLFGIPDIRLFWSQDERFLNQFQEGRVKKFEPFSKYPACYKDIAFWINASPASASPVRVESDSGVAAAAGGDSTKASPAETQPAAFHENDVMEIVRDIGGSLVEDVKLVDEFVHPRTGRKSLCYRINYRSLERTLTNDEINKLHEKVATRLTDDLGVELR
jgi:phenylalanyl-tRNA synthetase alpha chain